MIPASPDAYFEDATMKSSDIMLLENLSDENFPDLVSNQGLCAALKILIVRHGPLSVKVVGPTVAREPRFSSCHRREDLLAVRCPISFFLVL